MTTAEQCRAWHSDRDLFGEIWQVTCLLSDGHEGAHMGKDANGNIFTWRAARGEWEQR